MTIKGLYENVNKLNIEDVAVNSFVVLEDEFSDENKKQLFAGVNKEGNNLKPYASADYAFYKYNRNPIPGLGNPDLKDTGAFYNGIRTTISGKKIMVESVDSKNKELVDKYGGIFGLGGEFKLEFINQNLRPAFITEIRKRSGL